MKKSAIIGVGAAMAALLGLAVAGGSSASAAPSPAPRGDPPLELQQAATAAILARDPDALHEVADAMAAAGWVDQAAQLHAMADAMAAGDPITTTSGGVAGGLPTGVPGLGSLPGIGLPEGAASAVDPLAQLATAAIVAVMGQTRETYDREAVRQYQAAAGLPADGMYGLVTALSLAERGIVPPTPLHWGRADDWSSVDREKRQWRTAMLTRAMSDPARASEWSAAAEAV